MRCFLQSFSSLTGLKGVGQEAALYSIPNLISFLCYRTHTYTHREEKKTTKTKNPWELQQATTVSHHPSLVMGRSKAGLPCDIVNLSRSLATEIKQRDCKC